jgi:hypothetical protein
LRYCEENNLLLFFDDDEDDEDEDDEVVVVGKTVGMSPTLNSSSNEVTIIGAVRTVSVGGLAVCNGAA